MATSTAASTITGSSTPAVAMPFSSLPSNSAVEIPTNEAGWPVPTQAPLGPLTTSFVPNPDCFTGDIWQSTVDGSATISWLDQSGARTTCYPPGYSSGSNSQSSIYYSPAFCPESYVYAAYTLVSKGPDTTTFAYCCPNGIITISTSFCEYFRTLSASSGSSTSYSYISTYANAITVAWQESDLAHFTPISAPLSGLIREDATGIVLGMAPSSTTTSETQTSDSTKTSATLSPQKTNPAHSGLTTGQAAGIGVGVTIAGLLVIAGLVWFCLRRRRTKRESASWSRGPGDPNSPSPEGYAKGEAKINRGPYEVDNTGGIYEFEHQDRRAELEAGQVERKSGAVA